MPAIRSIVILMQEGAVNLEDVLNAAEELYKQGLPASIIRTRAPIDGNPISVLSASDVPETDVLEIRRLLNLTDTHAAVLAERERCASSVEKELTERAGPNWARIVAEHIRSGK